MPNTQCDVDVLYALHREQIVAVVAAPLAIVSSFERGPFLLGHEKARNPKPKNDARD